MNDPRIEITAEQVTEFLAGGRPTTANDIAEHYADAEYSSHYMGRASFLNQHVQMTSLKRLLDPMLEQGVIFRFRGEEMADRPYGGSPSAWYYTTPEGMERELRDRASVAEGRAMRIARDKAVAQVTAKYRQEIAELTALLYSQGNLLYPQKK